jgi:hypothetical protein
VMKMDVSKGRKEETAHGVVICIAGTHKFVYGLRPISIIWLLSYTGPKDVKKKI